MAEPDLFPETVVPHVPGPKRWVPADFIDETTQPGRSHPSDWITWAGAGEPVRIAWGDDEPEIVRTVAPGETMAFGWSIDHGRATFFVRSDGSWSSSRPIPEGANGFWVIGDPDTWRDDADEFVRDMIEFEWGSSPGDRSPIDPTAEIELDVGMVEWGYDEPFVLAIGPDGLPAFLPAADALARIAGLEARVATLTRRRDDLLEANNRYLERARSAEARFDLVAHLKRQTAFSRATFGPGPRTEGVLDHIRKELSEIEADPTDIMEWVDVIILAFDGAWRAGWSAEDIVSAIVAKQTKNEGRAWPDWRTAAPDKAIEHVREEVPHG